MLQLSEGRTGNHRADAGDASVGPDAADREFGNSQPDASPAGLDACGQRAIVDQRIADAGDATDADKRFATDQHATAGGCGVALARRHFGGRIELEEEKYEGRDQELFTERLATELDHDAYEVEAAFSLGEEAGEEVRGDVLDVGVGEEVVFGVGNVGIDARRDSPELPFPALRTRGDANNQIGV